jgi:hypothetical protein
MNENEKLTISIFSRPTIWKVDLFVGRAHIGLVRPLALTVWVLLN